MEIKEIKSLFIKNILPLTLIPILCFLLVLIFASLRKENYSSSVTLYTGLSSTVKNNSDFGRVNFTEINNDTENVISLLKSGPSKEDILIRVISKYLYDYQTSRNSIPKAYQKAFDTYLNETDRLRYFDSLGVNPTYKKIKMSIDKKDKTIKNMVSDAKSPFSVRHLDQMKISKGSSSDLVKIFFLSDNKKYCQDILYQTTVVFRNHFDYITDRANNNAVDFFEEKLKGAEISLIESEENLSEFMNSKQIINFEEQSKILVYDRQTAYNDYKNAERDMIAAESSFKELENKINNKNRFFSENIQLGTKKEKLEKLIIETAENSFTGENIDHESKQQEIDKLKTEIQNEILKSYQMQIPENGPNNEVILNSWLDRFIIYNTQKVNFEYNRKKFFEISNQIENFAPTEIQIKRLNREVDLSEAEYIEVLRAYQRSVLRQQNTKLTNSLKVVEPAEYNIKKDVSNSLFLASTSLFFSFLAVFLVLIAIELLKPTFRYRKN